ncbi:MAG: hypothetical protein LBN06_08060 [Prevotellaceae bacterium]|jgi:hypothetical protein|nr:hypothetical protein [Prevotellaceae bacterium]
MKMHNSLAQTLVRAFIRNVVEYIMHAGYLLGLFGAPQADAIRWACGQFADYLPAASTQRERCSQKQCKYRRN